MLLAAAALTLGSAAHADDNNVYEVSEDDDAWLHGHCAFLGTFITKDEHARLLDGEVAILVAQMGDDGRLAKRFACKDKPVFYTEAGFVPAVCEKLPEKDKARCDARFPKPPPPPPVVEAPEPAPPPVDSKKKTVKAKKPVVVPSKAAVRTAGF
jgi:hypothetical protein